MTQVRFVSQGEGGLVCKKLCSTLTTFFIKSPLAWEAPFLHLAMCLSQGDIVEPPNVGVENAQTAMSGLLPGLNTLQLTVLLWFAGTLAEEVSDIAGVVAKWFLIVSSLRSTDAVHLQHPFQI